MNNVPEIIPFTNRRATIALGVAILADLIQLPVNLSFFAAAASGVGLVAADIPLEALTPRSVLPLPSSSTAC
jgi:hypothetical protein